MLTFDDEKAHALGFAALNLLSEVRKGGATAGRPLVIAGRPGNVQRWFRLVRRVQRRSRARPAAAPKERVFIDLLGAPMPVVAACTGHAVAAGALLLLCCDHRVGMQGASRRRALPAGSKVVPKVVARTRWEAASRRVARVIAKSSRLMPTATSGSPFGAADAIGDWLGDRAMQW